MLYESCLHIEVYLEGSQQASIPSTVRKNHKNCFFQEQKCLAWIATKLGDKRVNSKNAFEIDYSFASSTFLGTRTFLECMKALLSGNCKLAAILVTCHGRAHLL